MIGVSSLRVLRGALQNFWRNFWLSLATTLIMTMTLLIVSFLYFANIFGLEVIKSVQQKVDLSVVFRGGVSQEQMENLARRVESRADVTGVNIVTSEQAKEIFLRNNQDRPAIAESLRELENNPLPASMFIVATEPRHYEAIAAGLSSNQFSELVAEVQFEDSRVVIENLVAIITAVKNVGVVVTIVFAALAMLIMFNTVRLAIYSFREEIDIMHLVGASGWFIRGPFVVESIFVALLATGLSSAMIYPTLSAASPGLRSFFFQGYSALPPFDIYQYAASHWPTIIGLQAVVAVSLAVVSSLIALQRYLKA
jgi:cell division transport system permease protein